MSDKLQPVNWLICDPNIEVTLPDVTQPQPCRQPAAAQLLKTRAGFRLQNGEQRWEQQLHGFWISSQVNRRGAEILIFSFLELSVGALDPRPNRQGSLTPTSLAVICLFVTIWAVHTCPGDLSTSRWVLRDNSTFPLHYSHVWWRIGVSRKLSPGNYCTVGKIPGEFPKALKMTFLGLKTIYIFIIHKKE